MLTGSQNIQMIAILFAPAILIALVAAALAWYFHVTLHDLLVFVAGAVFTFLLIGSVVGMFGMILGGGN